jgi:hypothetical protein
VNVSVFLKKVHELVLSKVSIICVVRAEAKETVRHRNTEDGLFSVRYALELKKEFRFQHLIKHSTTS